MAVRPIEEALYSLDGNRKCAGNGIIQTGNGIISVASRPRFNKIYFKKVSHLICGFQKLVLNTGNGIIRTGNGIIQTGNRIIKTGNGIISLTSGLRIRKLLLQNVSHLF